MVAWFFTYMKIPSTSTIHVAEYTVDPMGKFRIILEAIFKDAYKPRISWKVTGGGVLNQSLGMGTWKPIFLETPETAFNYGEIFHSGKLR